MSLTPEQITRTLESIEKDLAERQDPYSRSAEEVTRTGREFELRMVKGKLATNAETQTEKKDRALTAIAAADDDLYERYVAAEAKYEGQKAAIRVLEMRSMIGAALLKHQREIGG